MASDLISRKALLEAMDKEETEMEEVMCIPSWATAKHCIKDLPTVDRWIPCSERLPKEEGMYLITSNLFGSLEVQYVFYSENVQMFVCNGTPVAWMPLPSPYKAGDIDG